MPALYVKSSGSWDPVVQPYVKTGGSWVPVLSAWVKSGGTWSLFFTGFTAEAVPDPLAGSGTAPVVTVGPANITVTGGVGPFTYLWTKVSGDAINILTPTASSTNFRGTGMSASEIRTAVFQCAVTDTSTGLTENSNTITVEIEAF